jgi:flagellar motility protein MotE (MotC chaperone)
MSAMRLFPVLVFGLSALLAIKSIDALRRIDVVPSAQAAGGAAPAQPAAPATTTQRPAEAQVPSASSAETALAERLAERRRQLDDRSRELDGRENLLRAAERRIEERVEELRRLEARIGEGVQQRQQEQAQQMRALATMYENMRPAEAARVFDRLDLEVLFSLSAQMNPRRFAAVLAAMQPENAQRLTVEIARRSGTAVGARPAGGAQPAGAPGRELPRIDARRPG